LQLSSKESIASYNNFKGKLLEDVIGLYLHRILNLYNDVSLTYDSAKAGADFILRTGEKKFVIEVGFGDKKIDQVRYTLQRIKGNCGIVICGTDKLSFQDNILKIPLKYFLLL
jgi:predicted AAA+ superfamily ATPase